MTLWLCLRFPRLALQCQNSDEERPLALVAQQRLRQVNDCAAALGLAPGQGIATARALAGDELQLLARDREREADCLEELCCWAYGITPSLHCWREDSLLLEIGGCLRLFRGLAALLDTVDRGLARRALAFRRGLAATPKAAWLLSFAGEPAASAIEQPLEERLAPLPITLLGTLAPAFGALEKAGLGTLGDLLALPERALGRRCGRDAMILLQQVTGRAHDRQRDFHPPLRFRARHRFGYEVTGSEELQPAIGQLLDALQAFLRNTQQQTGTLHWHFIGARRQRQTLVVRASEGLADAAGWAGLTRTRLERYPLAEGAETLVLTCNELAPATAPGGDLFADAGSEPLASLRDRLRNRLGQQAIRHLACRSEHLPELAVTTGSEPVSGGEDACGRLRPFWLMPEPLPLRAGEDGSLHGHGRLVLLHGPERIEDSWWEAPVSRDYFVAEGQDGGRYWVFRDRRRDCWYLQGIFS